MSGKSPEPDLLGSISRVGESYRTVPAPEVDMVPSSLCLPLTRETVFEQDDSLLSLDLAFCLSSIAVDLRSPEVLSPKPFGKPLCTTCIAVRALRTIVGCGVDLDGPFYCKADAHSYSALIRVRPRAGRSVFRVASIEAGKQWSGHAMSP